MSHPLPTSDKRPWYREPYVWLLISGPAAVVLASFISIYLAVVGRDPVLDRTLPPVQLVPAAELEKMTEDERKAAERAALPARMGRNYAATPDIPKQ